MKKKLAFYIEVTIDSEDFEQDLIKEFGSADITELSVLGKLALRKEFVNNKVSQDSVVHAFTITDLTDVQETTEVKKEVVVEKVVKSTKKKKEEPITDIPSFEVPDAIERAKPEKPTETAKVEKPAEPVKQAKVEVVVEKETEKVPTALTVDDVNKFAQSIVKPEYAPHYMALLTELGVKRFKDIPQEKLQYAMTRLEEIQQQVVV